MRRLVSWVLLVFGLVVAGAGSAYAEPAPDAAEAKAVPGKKVCKIDNPVLTELSGMVATKNGYVVINDGVLTESGRRVFFLNSKCQVKDEVSYPTTPRDTEDLALSPDGKTLWIADIGDNPGSAEGRRRSVALWSMPADGSKKPVIHRLTYPDGPRDAEALLINGDGTPIVVTKEPGRAGLYVPTGPLKANNSEGVPMRRAGDVKLPATTTPNPLSGAGRLIVTGGAVAPDGSRVALRTYADAFEWDVKNGDVLGSMAGQPRATALPEEPFGEAITYSLDGKTFLTVSDMGTYSDEDVANHILRYTPAAELAVAAGPLSDKKAAGPSWFDQLSLQDITYLVGAVGILGALLVGAGVIGITRARRGPPTKTAAATPAANAAKAAKAAPAGAAAGLDDAAGDRWPGAVADRPGARPADAAPGGPGQRSGAVYGSGAAPSGPRPPATGPVYGGVPNAGPAAPSRGSVYGGRTPPADRSAGPPGGPPTPPSLAGGYTGGRPTPSGRPTPDRHGYGYADQAAGPRTTPAPEPFGYPDDYGYGPDPARP